MVSPVGRVVLITGGSSGIGKQLAADMVAAGDTVVIVAHEEPKLRAAERDLARSGPHVRAILCDVRRDEDVTRTVNAVLAEFGRIDVLVNNAGYAVYRAFEQSSTDEVLDIIDVNLSGSVRFIKACLPSMIARKGGQIVNVASIAGKMILTPNAAYGGAKHGIVALSEALDYELERFGIGVTVICPGRVETSFFDHETFQKRTHRKETQLTTTVEKVSATIIDAINRRKRLVFVPAYWRYVAAAHASLAWVFKPAYRVLMRQRMRSLYDQLDIPREAKTARS
jgi:short-subunit dehydrogenase